MTLVSQSLSLSTSLEAIFSNFPRKTKKRDCVYTKQSRVIIKKTIFTICTHVCKSRVDRDSETGPSFKLEVVDLEGLGRPQVELGDPDGHEAPQVLQGFKQAHVDVGIVGHATLQVVCELIFLAENKLQRSKNDEESRLHHDVGDGGNGGVNTLALLHN